MGIEHVDFIAIGIQQVLHALLTLGPQKVARYGFQSVKTGVAVHLVVKALIAVKRWRGILRAGNFHNVDRLFAHLSGLFQQIVGGPDPLHVEVCADVGSVEAVVGSIDEPVHQNDRYAGMTCLGEHVVPAILHDWGEYDQIHLIGNKRPQLGNLVFLFL